MLSTGVEVRVKPWFSGPYEAVYIYGVQNVSNKYNRKKCYIHRLVYEHFGRERETKSKRFVHHVDGDERNNVISNLKLTTLDENLKARKFFYKEKDGTAKRRKRGKQNSKTGPVV